MKRGPYHHPDPRHPRRAQRMPRSEKPRAEKLPRLPEPEYTPPAPFYFNPGFQMLGRTQFRTGLQAYVEDNYDAWAIAAVEVNQDLNERLAYFPQDDRPALEPHPLLAEAAALRRSA